MQQKNRPVMRRNLYPTFTEWGECLGAAGSCFHHSLQRLAGLDGSKFGPGP